MNHISSTLNKKISNFLQIIEIYVLPKEKEKWTYSLIPLRAGFEEGSIYTALHQQHLTTMPTHITISYVLICKCPCTLAHIFV